MGAMKEIWRQWQIGINPRTNWLTLIWLTIYIDNIKEQGEVKSSPILNLYKENAEESKQENISDDKKDINSSHSNIILTDNNKTDNFLKSITSLKGFKKLKFQTMHKAHITKTIRFKGSDKGDIVYSKHHYISVSKLISLLFSKAHHSMKISKNLTKKIFLLKKCFPSYMTNYFVILLKKNYSYR